MHLIPSVIVYGLTIGSFYGLLAVGFTLIYATTHGLNFAHGELASLSAYSVLFVVGFLARHISHSTSGPIVIVVSIAVGVVVGGVMGSLVERVAFWPLRSKPNTRLGSILITLGLSLLVDGLLVLRYPHGDQSLPVTLHLPAWTLFGAYVSTTNLVLVGGTVAIALGLDAFLRYGRSGKAMRATALDPEATALMGVRSARVIQATFAISGAIAGFAGAAYMLQYSVVDPFLGSRVTLTAFIAAVVGGMGSTRGALLGGLVIGFSEALCNTYISSEWTSAMSFAVLICVLLVRPQGLISERTVAARF